MTAADDSTSARGFFEAADGVRLHHRAWEAADPGGVVVVVHGLFEHSGRYDEAGAALARNGLSTFAFDHRGHGLSEGPRGHTPRFRLLLDDLDRFVDRIVRPAAPDLPLFMLAHSLGGLVGLRYLQEGARDLVGAVISSPWLATALPAPAWKVAMARALSPILPAIPTRVRLDPRDLTRDPERVADYRDDPRIHSVVTPRMYTEVTDAMDRVVRGAALPDIPLLFLLAGADRIVDSGTSQRYARAVEGADVQVEVVDGAFHEVLQEPDREERIRRIAEWVRARLP